MIDWKGIAEGVRNKLIPPSELKELIEATFTQRMEVCEQCEFLRNTVSGPRCGKCGCFLKLKARCLKCQCPIDKWMPVTDAETSELVKITINGSSS